jgi:hypothetical protein
LPYSIAMANRYTRLNNIIGIASLAISIPGSWYGTYYFGATGAAVVWATIQLLTSPLYIYLINKKFMTSMSLMKQLLKYFIMPLIIAFLTAYIFMKTDPTNNYRVASLFWIGFSTLTSIIISSLIIIDKNTRIKAWRLLKMKIVTVAFNHK